MIRLYNHTSYPDAQIRDILTFAARAVGVKGDVPVRVTRGRRLMSGAEAYNSKPYRRTLTSKRGSEDKRILNCPRGWVRMSLPDPKYIKWCGEHGSTNPALDAAEWFTNTAIHEMSHIRDYRERREFPSTVVRHRRIAHDKRPCEILAENRVDEVITDPAKNRRRQELALALALVMES
jgi:hypothetical protein